MTRSNPTPSPGSSAGLPPSSGPEGERVPWWHLPVDEVEGRLGSRVDGLSSEEAARRLLEFGPNRIRAEEVAPWWSLVLHQFRDPLIYILLAAAGVTLAIRDYLDAAVIMAVVLLNALIGFIQEYRAQQAMRALAQMSAPRAEVLRDAQLRSIPAEELVPGDVVRLTSGSRVPADLRLFRVTDLEVDESALTGESLPVRKQTGLVLSDDPVVGDQVNLAFGATMVSRGRGRGLVIRTGARTEVGRIAEAVIAAAGGKTPLQEEVHSFGKRVGFALLGLSAIAVLLGMFHGLPAIDIFLTTVAMAVSAVPEGLPVVLTVTLAVGVRRMAARRAIVRRLPAVETLGSTTVIASDKTGTLTRNQMTVRTVWAGGEHFRVTGGGYDPEGAFFGASTPSVAVDMARCAPLRETLRVGVLASEADSRMIGEEGEPLGDPTEVALLVAAAKAGLLPADLRAGAPELDVFPFEPDLQFMAALVQEPSGPRIHLKGSPEAVLARCGSALVGDGVGPIDPEAVRAAAHALAAEGLRVLAMAIRDVAGEQMEAGALAGGFTFCGLQAMEDPVRPEAVESVAAVQRAGIRVLMLTGDHVTTARTIGAQLGMDGAGQRAVEGRELARLSDPELDALLEEGVQVFARVAPEHKLRIVQRLKARGEVVAVTGDGVNDAPALRAAHLGIAMGRSGTDVAREAADMILQDDNFATIRAAVEEGRVVFSNVRKVTFFLLSTAVGEVITILVALAFGWPLPFVAVQILWINLVTNGLQDVALAVEPGEPGLLARRPRPMGEGILPFRLLERLFSVGLLLAVGTLLVFWWSYETTGDLTRARTVAMTQMVVFQFFHVFNCRSLDRSIFRIPFFSNRFLFLSLIAVSIAQFAVLYWTPLATVFRTVPVTPSEWAVIVGVASTVIVGGELDKAWQRYRHRELG